MRSLYENYPIVYTFDDHDAGSDNTNGNAFSINEVNQVYREIVPHYPLTSSLSKGIQQTFVAADTLFIITDLRSYLFTERVDNKKESVYGLE